MVTAAVSGNAGNEPGPQSFGLVRGDAEPAAALARPRLAHGFGQTINREFGMTVDRFGNPVTASILWEVRCFCLAM